MAKNPSRWSPKRLLLWLQADREANHQRHYKRIRAKRLQPFESLEDRDMMAILVNQATTSILPDAPAIVIQGSGFDPIVSNLSVVFSDGSGTVTAATETQLTVEFATQPSAAGALTVVVSSLTENSGSPVQVATVVPKVTSSTANLAANANGITIYGSGFSTTAANNTVAFNNGATGNVTAATATSLTVTFVDRPTTAGPLTVQVTSNSVVGASGVQVARVIPVVTASSTNLDAGSATLTIDGFGFDPTDANNVVDFDGEATGTVTAATATQLTVTFNTAPNTAGDLLALVTTGGISANGSVKVATVVPVITSSIADLAANASTVTINGFGFGATAGSNTVAFNNGAVGTVTSATANVLNVTFTTKPTAAGELRATVTSNGVASASLIQVATVIPVITRRTVSLAANATSLTIFGFGFDTTLANNSVVLDRGAVGTVSAATSTSLTINLSTAPTSAGSITAVVTTNSASSGTAVQVANVTPVITSSTTSFAANATTLTINGFGFSSTAASNTVQFNNGAVGNVSNATATTLTVTITTAPTAAGTLTAVVTTNSVSSGTAVQVATVAPVVTVSTTNRGANSNTIIISGFGFSSVVGNNTVTFDNGAVGAVTSASATSLTVTYSTRPTSAGVLNATVTTNGVAGSATQVATITPVVTSRTSSLAANATTLMIYGFGFDPTSANNTVVLTNGAVGTVSNATPTMLTVNLTTGPTSAGSITAVVTSNSLGSGSAVQVASVRPVVTSATTNLAADSATVDIAGFGFDTTNGNNLVTFNNGATGSVTNATATLLTVTFSAKPTSAGTLTAVVRTNSISSGSAVQVATLIPAITSSTASLNANASTITIQGFGFDTTAGDNVVTFDKGAAGSVIAATPTSLTVRFTTNPTSAGALSASVSTDSLSSGAPVQVATVIPVVSNGSSSLLAADANSVTIRGFGFDSTAANNTVTFVGGAVGTVTSATATTLVVNLTTRPSTAGLLTASVTTNSQSSGAAVPVAKVTPVVTLNAGAVLLANASTIQIVGLGFDTTPANNTVVFDSGAIGSVSTATASLLTVTFSTKPTAGDLNAVVISNGVSNGSAVKVATVKPTVTSSIVNLAANAARVTIDGAGFDTTATNNTVTFNNGAAGTVTAATPTSLTVTFTTKPTSAGNLSAVVTTNSVSSGATTQVATVVPVVTATTTSLSPNSSSVTITGVGFDPTPANNLVDFNNGAIGTVTAASATSLTVTFSKKPRAAGSLTALVTSNGVPSAAAVQVARVTPLVLANTNNRLTADATTLTINGLGFDSTAANNTVVFSNGAIGNVTNATSNALTISLTKGPNSAGSLTAIVTTNSVSSGAAVQVGFFAPVVTVDTTALAADATTLTINGFGFDKTAANNSVVFDNGAVGSVTAATSTTLTVTLSTKPTTADALNAVVTTNGINSGAQVQVATVTPVVTEATGNLPANSGTVVINGFGFSATASENSVLFNNDAVGTVTTASPTQLTVTLSQKPSAVGSLTAVVTTRSENSGSAVQIADVSPVVTGNTDSLAADATSLTIYGFGFDPTAANNSVVFNRGAVGNITNATETSLTISLTTKPTDAGILTAVVTTNDIESGAAVQVATVKPVVTSSIADLAADATSVVINGLGFDPTAARNTIVFNNGAVGVVSSASATSLTVN
ncbi:MAG: IPT/TIG domain-containing protein, partial [Pirellulaceae bacterium]|nr:IPT/TIG domain-containing protein [Pirellulaceae bacterium]